MFKFPDIESLEMNIRIDLKNASKSFNKENVLKNRNRFEQNINEARTNKDSYLRKLDETWFKALKLPLQTLDLLYVELLKKL